MADRVEGTAGGPRFVVADKGGPAAQSRRAGERGAGETSPASPDRLRSPDLLIHCSRADATKRVPPNSGEGRTVGVVIPTYNERENIAALVKGVLGAGQNVHAVVVDDNSPDGTGDVADALARGEPRIIVVHRYTARGRGTAGRDGFLRCIVEGFDFIMEMDADFSHDPAEIPKLLAAVRDADVAIGSRLVPGGQEEGRSLLRSLMTLAANFYLRHALGVPRVRDCTSGFRCFRREALISADVGSLKSRGPSIVTEILFRCRKMRIVEVPIHFGARAAGKSKFGLKAIVEGLLVPPKLWWREILGG